MMLPRANMTNIRVKTAVFLDCPAGVDQLHSVTKGEQQVYLPTFRVTIDQRRLPDTMQQLARST